MKNKIKISSLFLLLLIFFLICSDCVYAQDETDDMIRVSKLKIKGNKAIETKEIRQTIETQAPSIKPWVKKPEFDPDVFKDDIQRIKELFANNGYYDAVVDYKLNYNDTGDRVKIYITIEQGSPVILRSLSIVIKNPAQRGNPYGEEYLDIRQKIIETIPLEAEKEFSPLKFEQAKSDINLICSNLGYPKHEIESEALVNRSEKWAEVSFNIIPGDKYRFGNIEIVGNKKIPTYLVRREIIFEPGEVYSLEKVSESQTRIFQLGLFKSVIINQIYNDDTLTVDTLITVVDRKLGSIRFGVGFGTIDIIRGQIGWTQRNFLGGGRNLEVLTKASFIVQLIQTSITQPHVVGRDSELTALVNFQRDDLPGYEGSSVLSSLTLSKRLSRHLRGNGSFNVIYSRINSQATRTPIEQSQENVFLTTFGGGLNYNTTDNIFDPKKGVFADQRFETALKLFGSNVNYLLSFTDVRAYKEIRKDVVIAKR
ncbi:MAG: POTRA domain-containing protein, partial [Thermodesulfobacteriota bacterium]